MNRVLARCPNTNRVLITGPEVAPASLRWVILQTRHTRLPTYQTAVVTDSESTAYAQIVNDHLTSSSEYQDDAY